MPSPPCPAPTYLLTVPQSVSQKSNQPYPLARRYIVQEPLIFAPPPLNPDLPLPCLPLLPRNLSSPCTPNPSPQNPKTSYTHSYINVDASAGRELFYVFAEARVSDPTQAPLLLWLNG